MRNFTKVKTTPQTTKSLKSAEHSVWRWYATRLLVWLVAIGAVMGYAFLLGYFLQGILVDSFDEVRAMLENLLSGSFTSIGIIQLLLLALRIFPISIPFIVVGYGTGYRLISFTALLAFVLSGVVQSLSLTRTVGLYMPRGETDEDFGSNAVFTTTVVVSFIVALLMLYLLSRFLHSYTHTRRAMWIGLAALLAGLGIGLELLAKTTYPAILRHRDTVYIADQDAYVGDGKYIHYSLSDTTRVRDTVSYKKIDDPYRRSVQYQCSTQALSFTNYPKQSATYEYLTTPQGQTYGHLQLVGTASNTRTASNEYYDNFYCFVAGYYRYTIVRSGRIFPAAQQEQFPMDAVIDAIYAGRPVVAGCSAALREYVSPKITSTPDYCDDATISAGRLATSALRKQADAAEQNASSPTDSHFINPDAYQVAGRLPIAEWGISVPLVTNITSGHYAMSTERPEATLLIGIQNLNGGSCYRQSGERFVAQIIRKRTADNEQQYQESLRESGGNSFVWFRGTPLADGFTYQSSALLSAEDCLRESGYSAEETATLVDSFRWMESQLQTE